MAQTATIQYSPQSLRQVAAAVERILRTLTVVDLAAVLDTAVAHLMPAVVPELPTKGTTAATTPQVTQVAAVVVPQLSASQLMPTEELLAVPDCLRQLLDHLLLEVVAAVQPAHRELALAVPAVVELAAITLSSMEQPEQSTQVAALEEPAMEPHWVAKVDQVS